MDKTLMRRLAAMGVRFADGDPDTLEGAAPQQPQATQAATPQPQPQQPAQVTADTGGDVNEHGYPDDTPLERMTETQRTAYWRHKARRHEETWKTVRDRNLTPEQVVEMQQRLNDLEREQMDEHQRAVADAKNEGVETERARLMPSIVQARIEAAVARVNPGMTADDVQAKVEFLDLTKFLTPKGEVDTDKVSTYAASLTPTAPDGTDTAGKKFPDMGGGKRGPVTVSAKARAADVARARGWVRD